MDSPQRRTSRTAAATGTGDWSSLPEELLLSITPHITSFLDLAVFSAVCCSWRAAALAAAGPPQNLPPLLLSRSISQPLLWQVHDPGSSPPAVVTSSRRGTISIKNIPEFSSLIGLSHGCLILAEDVMVSADGLILFNYSSIAERRTTVVNPSSGKDFCSPPLPPGPDDWNQTDPTIVAILLNSSTLLVLMSFITGVVPGPYRSVVTILQWHIGAVEWASSDSIRFTDHAHTVCHLAALHDGRLLLASRDTLFTLTLQPGSRITELAPLPGPQNSWCECFTCLAVNGEELIFLRFFLLDDLKLVAYSLKMSALAPPEWERIFTLGGSAIFLTLKAGVSPLVCQNPERWGLRRGCIYFAKCDGFEYTGDDGRSNGVWYVR